MFNWFYDRFKWSSTKQGFVLVGLLLGLVAIGGGIGYITGRYLLDGELYDAYMRGYMDGVQRQYTVSNDGTPDLDVTLWEEYGCRGYPCEFTVDGYDYRVSYSQQAQVDNPRTRIVLNYPDRTESYYLDDPDNITVEYK